MQHLYDVHYVNRSGQVEQTTVGTANHHENHDAAWWTAHIIDLLEQVGVKVVSDGISKIVYRGRR